MANKLKGLLLGDAMIPSEGFRQAWDKHLSRYGDYGFAGDWEPSWDNLQFRRLEVEKNGPDIEPPEPLALEHSEGVNTLLGLFIPISKALMDALPELRIAGVCRAGVENVNLAEATERGILVFNTMGRNAHAVSDFAIGMMLAEGRNIARAHFAIKNGEWRKTFSNSDHVPELKEKTIGLVGFGYIGQLVAKKLSGFNVDIIVYDPYADPAVIQEAGARQVDLEDLFKSSDFISLHARMSEETKGMVNERLLSLMKPTAYLINTGRAGLVEQDALIEALREKRIAGAALDVFITEPLEDDSPYKELDNVTLTTHIAGTTEEALSSSPFLLMEDIAAFLESGKARFIKNPEVLDNEGFRQWLESLG